MSIKRINLARWMTSPKEVNRNSSFGSLYESITPIYNRNGIYSDGKKSWFEVDGLAYTYPINDFNLEFSIIKIRELSNVQAKALSIIVDAGLATKEQKEMVNLYRCYGRKFTLSNLREKKRFNAAIDALKSKKSGT